jgi:uncharacterized protein DUF6459
MRSTSEMTAIRLRPVPRHDPPFDDELAPQVWASARQLTLDWDANQQLRRAAAPVKAPTAVAGAVAGASADAKLAVRRFVHLCVEVLNGYRPPAHLRRLSAPSEAADVVAQGLAGARRIAELRTATRVGPRRSHRVPPVAVLRLRLCEPRPGAVEAAVALVTGERTWAMALRLELREQSWCATALTLI